MTIRENYNGTVIEREMTEVELADYNLALTQSNTAEPTIESLQAQVTELQEALNLLLTGATE